MKNLTAVTAALAAIALSVGLAGCDSDSKTNSTTTTTTMTTSAQASPSPTEAARPNKTIHDYLQENNIAETAVQPGQPGAPVINLPAIPGWTGEEVRPPQGAYAAAVYTKPENPNDPPGIVAIVAKLPTDADPAKILEFAPGELKNLPNWEPLGDPNKSTLSGFDAVQLRGYYMKDDKKRIIAQKTVVIPGQDGLYVLQMNADALDGQETVLMDATSVIDEKTTITP